MPPPGPWNERGRGTDGPPPPLDRRRWRGIKGARRASEGGTPRTLACASGFLPRAGEARRASEGGTTRTPRLCVGLPCLSPHSAVADVLAVELLELRLDLAGPAVLVRHDADGDTTV